MTEAKPEKREGITGAPRDEANLREGRSLDPSANDESDERQESSAGGEDGAEVGENPEHAEEQSDGHDDMERSTGQS